MAGKVLNINVCSPLKQRSGLTGESTQSATTHIYRWRSFAMKILLTIPLLTFAMLATVGQDKSLTADSDTVFWAKYYRHSKVKLVSSRPIKLTTTR